jgi:acyl carrier protein
LHSALIRTDIQGLTHVDACPPAKAMTEDIRSILRQHARLASDVDTLGEDADLYAAGLTSHATVNLMIALEEHFGVEFPERMLRRRAFESIAAIRAAITELTSGQAQ